MAEPGWPQLPFDGLPPASPRDPQAEWREFTDAHLAELLADSLAYALGAVAARALTAQQTEIARLRAQLDRYQGRTVFHCNDAHLDAVAAGQPALTPDARPGDILRATDTGREMQYRGGGEWVPR